MRIGSWALIILGLFTAVAPAQTVSADFKFPIAKPGEELTVDGTSLDAIKGITLRSDGGPPVEVTDVRATPNAVKFKVPSATASGNYTVALTPGFLSIPLTVTAPSPTSTENTTATGPSTSPSVPAGPEVYMPDGQLKSHAVIVYLTSNIESEQHPCLQLTRNHEITKAKDEDNCYPPMFVVPGQKWKQTEQGSETEKSGTLLMFDLKRITFSGKAMMRVRPVVYWNEGEKWKRQAGRGEVNLGDSFWIFVWTAVILIVAVGLILILSRLAKRNLLYLLIGAEGRLSLAQTQMAFWTVAVGGVVLGYGLLRQETPTIPGSLLALMGASLATGGLAFFGDTRRQGAAGASTNPPASADKPTPQPLKIRDLLLVFPPAEGELSLSKAQMLFWTILLLVLFISKSTLDGVIWDMPWGLVALMGFSQLGFVVPKFVPDPAPPAPPVPPPPEPPKL